MNPNVPVTIYRPQREGEMSSPGISDITDTTGVDITDTTKADITDTGTLLTPIPATVYVENDGV